MSSRQSHIMGILKMAIPLSGWWGHQPRVLSAKKLMSSRQLHIMGVLKSSTTLCSRYFHSYRNHGSSGGWWGHQPRVLSAKKLMSIRQLHIMGVLKSSTTFCSRYFHSCRNHGSSGGWLGHQPRMLRFMQLTTLPIVFLMGSLLVGTLGIAQGQNVDLDNAMSNFRKKVTANKKLKITGGINASTTYTKSTVGNLRDPLVYAVNGNVNFSWMSISIPLSLNFTNAGFSYSYQFPRLPNRLSLHPKYKKVQAHIGDFSMNFSPYTMSGFQIVGSGLDVQQIGKWKFSGFYGRFQKPVPYMPDNGNNLAAYGRYGYGLKVSNDQQKMQTAFSFIRIQDKVNSLAVKPDSVNIFPKSNIAFSLENKISLIKNLKFDYEIGVSFLTNDLRSELSEAIGYQKIVSGFIKTNNSTNFYKAFKSNLTYTLGSSNVGIGYERIDPNYQTLGAYYFTNDFENITASFAQQLFKSKLSLSFTAGIQKDDLKKEKAGSTRRLVTAINGSINASKKFTSSFTYSNFQSFSNIKPQFQLLNQLTPFDNLDTLNFRQLSQNANVSFNFMLRADKEVAKVLNINLSLQDSYDQQAGVVAKGNSSQFYNLVANYMYSKIPKNMNISGGFNATYNTIGKANSITAGPTLMVNKMFFNKKVRANVTGAYNVSIQQTSQKQSVISGRMNANYTLFKKHQIGWSATYMSRTMNGKKGNDFSTSLNYSYAF
jgi:hypothetical protein